MAVLAAHAAFISGLAASSSPALPYASRFEVAVSIFFAISGFVLYRPYVRARLRDTGPPSLARYASARVLRIVPAYWLALAVIAAWLGLSGVFTPRGIVTYFGFLQVYDPDTFKGGLVQAWTLCDEAAFYLLLPFYAGLLRRIRRPTAKERLRDEWIGVGTLFAAGTAWTAAVLIARTPSVSRFPLLFSLPAFIDQIAIGMALAVLAESLQVHGRERRWLATLDRWPSLGIAAALIAFWAAATRIGLHGGAEPVGSVQWALRHLLFSIVVLGLMAPAIFGTADRGLTRRFLNLRPLAWLGDVSYGIYLWHLAFLIQIKRWGFDPHLGATLNWVAWTLIAAVPTILVAAASWYWIERPALSLRSRLARARLAPEPEAPAVRAADALASSAAAGTEQVTGGQARP